MCKSFQLQRVRVSSDHIQNGSIVHPLTPYYYLGPFTFLPGKTRPASTRPLVLDQQSVNVSGESGEELDLRLYKTTNREMYDRAYERGGESSLSLVCYVMPLFSHNAIGIAFVV